MYFTLDEIKGIADDARKTELRKELTGKLTHYRLDFSAQMYRDEIVKSIGRVSLDYLKLMAPRFNGQTPSYQDLRKTAQDMRNLPRSGAHRGLSLDDRARYFVRNSSFKPQEVADFIASKAERHRAERTASLTLINFSSYQERLKVEDEVIERYQAGVYFFKTLEDFSKRELKPADEMINRVTSARAFMQIRLDRTIEMKKAVDGEMRRYMASPTVAQQSLKP